MPNIVLDVIQPGQLQTGGEGGQFDIGRYAKRYLAQGDSWFSIGHIPPWCTSNLLQQMVLGRAAVAVNCARPGAKLAHMTDTTSNTLFLNLLRGRLAFQWDAILLSGGGNDLIDAVQLPATNAPEHRLLRPPIEWGPASDGAARYFCNAGWATFSAHLNDVFDIFIAERDRGINLGAPVLCHAYDYLTPRHAPAGFGFGPWLYNAVHDEYALPPEDWNAFADLLIDRLFALLIDIIAKRPTKNLHLVDSRGAALRALPGTVGENGDWENEIHPSAHGYGLMAARWRPLLDGMA